MTMEDKRYILVNNDYGRYISAKIYNGRLNKFQAVDYCGQDSVSYSLDYIY